MVGLFEQYVIVRKSLAFVKQIPRAFNRVRAKKFDYYQFPPVLANSFPKSGTHLLLQIVEAFPNVINYRTFIASMPSVTFKERSHKAHLRLINKIVPGEVIPAHLFYHSDYSNALAEKNCVQFFIYRDPRDVVISDAWYLANMNRWHRMHKYFKAIQSWDERISRAILGLNDPDFPYDYPNVAKRFSQYRDWLESADVFSIKYEDLISSHRQELLNEIAAHYLHRCKSDQQVEDIVIAMEANINPEKSHTFREGGAGKWKDAFTDDHKSQMKQVAGQLLIELGYEKDLAW